MRKSCDCYASNYWRHNKNEKDTEKRKRDGGKPLGKKHLKLVIHRVGHANREWCPPELCQYTSDGPSSKLRCVELHKFVVQSFLLALTLPLTLITKKSTSAAALQFVHTWMNSELVTLLIVVGIML